MFCRQTPQKAAREKDKVPIWQANDILISHRLESKLKTFAPLWVEPNFSLARVIAESTET
jgi:hypothetical protein